ncbi:hypothetical protein ABI214_00425 [Prescottella soli]|uniref:Head-tail adaptor protein n=1 Tax=Prescottella soli TaxID=1543852 RepID=A0ABW9G1Z6_9NOCA
MELGDNAAVELREAAGTEVGHWTSPSVDVVGVDVVGVADPNATVRPGAGTRANLRFQVKAIVPALEVSSQLRRDAKISRFGYSTLARLGRASETVLVQLIPIVEQPPWQD